MTVLPDNSVWFYDPNEGAAVFFSALFSVFGIAISSRAWQGGLRKFFWIELIGISWEVVGFAVRAAASDHITDVAPFAAPQSLIVLAPLWIAEGIYLICNRMITAASKQTGILGIPVRWITPTFVTDDILTLLIQVSGTSIAAGVEWEGSQANVGSYILIGGLAAQTATLVLFIAIISRFAGLRLSLIKPGQPDWILGFRSAFLGSVMILVRCVYRLIEFATGIDGYLFTHEWPFYVFEALPMVIAIGGLVVVYPPHHILDIEKSRHVADEDTEMQQILDPVKTQVDERSADHRAPGSAPR